jgi:hypothetical protein
MRSRMPDGRVDWLLTILNEQRRLLVQSLRRKADFLLERTDAGRLALGLPRQITSHGKNRQINRTATGTCGLETKFSFVKLQAVDEIVVQPWALDDLTAHELDSRALTRSRQGQVNAKSRIEDSDVPNPH